MSTDFTAAIGRLERVQVDGRNVDVLIPPGPLDVPRPLLLAHDGQNLFEPGHSFGGVPWALDRALASLVANGTLVETEVPLVVAPWNREGFGRAADYTPEVFVRSIPEASAGFEAYFSQIDWCGDEYVRWCAEDLIFPIAERFGVAVDRDNVAVMGSSMGGLASAYALGQRPDVYSTALCVSTHWTPGGHEFAKAMVDLLPAPESGARIWFDHGDQGLDATYGEFQATADARMRERGYRPGRNWHSQEYPGADHNEASWALRLPQIIQWWLAPQSSEQAA
mgnify:CR=1 FL=1